MSDGLRLLPEEVHCLPPAAEVEEGLADGEAGLVLLPPSLPEAPEGRNA